METSLYLAHLSTTWHFLGGWQLLVEEDRLGRKSLLSGALREKRALCSYKSKLQVAVQATCLRTILWKDPCLFSRKLNKACHCVAHLPFFAFALTRYSPLVQKQTSQFFFLNTDVQKGIWHYRIAALGTLGCLQARCGNWSLGRQWHMRETARSRETSVGTEREIAPHHRRNQAIFCEQKLSTNIWCHSQVKYKQW